MTLTRRATMLFAALGALSVRGARAEPLTCCPIVELRQYTLRPGQREVLVELFERAFIEPQEALGMSIIGTFRDLDNPDRFVWLRGFSGMTQRPGPLTTFYSGPHWKANSKAANATMIDSDNVLLLRPTRPNTVFTLNRSKRPPIGATTNAPGLVTATIYYFDKPADASFQKLFDQEAVPVLRQAGAVPLASFVTESTPNNFPALPVRENESVFIWFTSFESEAAYAAHVDKLTQTPAWQSVDERIRHLVKTKPEVLRLQPTARSLLHG
jgi:hypothetical protein